MIYGRVAVSHVVMDSELRGMFDHATAPFDLLIAVAVIPAPTCFLAGCRLALGLTGRQFDAVKELQRHSL